MYVCWKCEKELDVTERVGRQELCPHCSSSLHACKNCAFWDRAAHNQCREPQAAYVPDRESGNFCDYFQFVLARAVDVQADAKARLDAAFASLEAKGKVVLTPPSNDPRSRIDRAFGGSGAPKPSRAAGTESEARKRLEELFKKKS